MKDDTKASLIAIGFIVWLSGGVALFLWNGLCNPLQFPVDWNPSNAIEFTEIYFIHWKYFLVATALVLFWGLPIANAFLPKKKKGEEKEKRKWEKIGENGREYRKEKHSPSSLFFKHFLHFQMFPFSLPRWPHP